MTTSRGAKQRARRRASTLGVSYTDALRGLSGPPTPRPLYRVAVLRSASLVDADLWRASGGEPLRIARYRIRLESPISFLELDAIFGERGWSVTRRILSAGQTWAELHLAPAEWPLLLGALCQEPGTTCTHASLHTLVSDAVASGSATFADIASATGMSRDEVSRLAARRAAS